MGAKINELIMDKALNYIRTNFVFLALSSMFLFFLFNPVFKKYDYGSEWPSVLAFCLILPLLYIKDRKDLLFSKDLPGTRSLEKIFFGIFAIFMILSFAFSQTKNIGLSEVMAYLSCFGVYFLLAHRKVEWTDKIIKTIVLSTIAASVLGTLLYIFRDEPRLFGPFFNLMHHGNLWPNAFALFLLMTWPLLLSSKYKNFLPFVLSALLLTYSRGAIIAFAGQLFLLFLYWLFYLKKPGWRLAFKDFVKVVIVAAATVLLFLGINSLRAINYPVINIEERATFQNSESLTSKQERVDFWESAIRLAEEKPLLGWGPFSFRYANYPIQKTFLGASDHPHNIFLKMAAENGLVAAGAFLAFLITVFTAVSRRFRGLEKEDRMKVMIFGVGILGALAHSMIDYNFNFMATLILFFLLLGLMRSLVSGNKQDKIERRGFPVGVFFVTIMLAMWAVYELSLGVANKLSMDKTYLDQSFYPRNSFLNRADAALADKDYETALKAANKEIALNSLDAQAWYLRGVIYCKPDFELHEEALCKESLAKALEINPMNDFNYYNDYIRLTKDANVINRAKGLLNLYFGYVENNVHFTAYTPNVEAAAALVEELLPYLSSTEALNMKLAKDKMLKTAKRLRDESTKIL